MSATAAAAATPPPTLGPLCDNCGRDAGHDEIVRGLLLCGRCRERHALLATVHAVVAWATTIVTIVYVMPHLLVSVNGVAQIGHRAYLPAGELLAFYLALVVGMVLHESAHAACARGFGFIVEEIHLGEGRVLGRLRLGRIVAVIHLVPFGGLMRWRPGDAVSTPAKRAAVAAAGPLTNLILAALCWAARARYPELAIPGACANLLAFIHNALPCPYSARTSAIPNDGWHVLTNLRPGHLVTSEARRRALTRRCTVISGTEGAEATLRFLRGEIERAGGDYPDAEAWLSMCLLTEGRSRGEIEEGFERSARLVHDRRAFRGMRAVALNNRAYFIAVGGWRHLLADAEWAAREALRVNPRETSFRGTAALVLARLGRLQEAERLVTEVIGERMQALGRVKAHGGEQGPLTRSLAANRATLAIVYRDSGRLEQARSERAAARLADPSCTLLPELDATLDGHGAAAATTTTPGGRAPAGVITATRVAAAGG